MEEALAEVVQLVDTCCARCTTVCDLSRRYADLMGLRDWDFEVDHDPPTIDGALAEIELHGERRVGRLRVHGGGWEAAEPEEKRHAIAHELAHAMVRDLMEAVRAGARQEFGGAALRLYLLTVEREHEKLADVIATAVGPVLPLP